MYRSIKHVKCSCSGVVKEVETTDDEEKEFGCGKKGCCVNAYQCDKCGTRFIFVLEAPEIFDD